MENKAKLEHGKAVIDSKDKGNLYGATCPYCKSIDTYKISNISKGIALGIFGKYALHKVYKQWHCNECNSDF